MKKNLSNIEGLEKGSKEKIRLIVETGTCPDAKKFWVKKN